VMATMGKLECLERTRKSPRGWGKKAVPFQKSVKITLVTRDLRKARFPPISTSVEMGEGTGGPEGG